MAEIIDFNRNSAYCQVVDWKDGKASLSNLYSAVRGRGHATSLLHEVMNWIDDRGLLLKTTAESFGPEPKLSDRQLMEFYMKFGFMPLEDAVNSICMERKSKSPKIRIS